jgi:hypothetical protein
MDDYKINAIRLTGECAPLVVATSTIRGVANVEDAIRRFATGHLESEGMSIIRSSRLEHVEPLEVRILVNGIEHACDIHRDNSGLDMGGWSTWVATPREGALSPADTGEAQLVAVASIGPLKAYLVTQLSHPLEGKPLESV